jgi:hypothetical protein
MQLKQRFRDVTLAFWRLLYGLTAEKKLRSCDEEALPDILLSQRQRLAA